MSVRFRIRTAAGQELSFASREMFEDFVRSGDLSPDDLVYDGEDGSWAPARTHPIVLGIEYEQEDADEEEGRADQEPAELEPAELEAAEVEAAEVERPGAEEDAAPDDAFGLSLAPAAEAKDAEEAPPEAADGVSDAGAEAPTEADSGDLGLELAVSEEISPEDASRAFVEKLEAERLSDLELDVGAGISGFTMERTGSLADLAADADEPAPEPPEPRRPERPSPPSRSSSDDPWGGRDRTAGRRAEPAPRRKEPSGGGGGRLVGAAVLVAILAGGGYVAFQRMGQAPSEPASGPDTPVTPIAVEPAPEPPAREPVIARTEAAVRDRALERFLTSSQAALRDLRPIPDYWPGGAYLVMPSAHPELTDVWREYLSTSQRVRAADTDRYRTAYEAALDDAVIEGAERDERLARGVAAFAGSEAARAAHYDRVEALASAAIQSHNALLEAEGLLILDGPGEVVADGPIGAGVTARDEDSRLLLENVVELLTAMLEADGAGPGTGENVRAWVWDGFLDAVAN